MNQIIKLFYFLLFTYLCAEDYHQAALLPVTHRKRPHLGRVDYFLLARDKNTGLWNFFSAEKKIDENNPTQTAARAFTQTFPQCPIISHDSLQNYIDLSQHHTAYVIENENNNAITFITRFGARKIKNFKRCFFEQGCGSTIDALALVRWENIEQMMLRNKDTACAFIQFPKKEEFREITFSQEFIDAVKPFFLRKSFAVSDDRRVRIY